MAMRNVLFIVPLLAALAASGTALGQSEDDLAVGKIEFRSSCASCHGIDGRGDGPIQVFLKVKPADLTQLSANNGGVYPAELVYQIIDGQADIAVHGERTMPVWGLHYLKEFAGFGDQDGNEELVQARIRRLVDYLETLQE